MTGTNESKWTLTATVITAVGTVLAGLAAVAALVLPRTLDGSGSTSEPDPSLTDSSGKPLPNLDGVLLWDRATIVLVSQVDLDGSDGPNREPETLTTDVYLWLDGEISAPHGMVKWTGANEPNQSDCTKLVRSHSVSDHLVFDVGDVFCLRTNQNRIGMVKVLPEISTGWEMEFTVWKQRLS